MKKLDIYTRHRTSGDKVKTLMIADRDGNHIAFAEAIDLDLTRNLLLPRDRSARTASR